MGVFFLELLGIVFTIFDYFGSFFWGKLRRFEKRDVVGNHRHGLLQHYHSFLFDFFGHGVGRSLGHTHDDVPRKVSLDVVTLVQPQPFSFFVYE